MTVLGILFLRKIYSANVFTSYVYYNLIAISRFEYKKGKLCKIPPNNITNSYLDIFFLISSDYSRIYKRGRFFNANRAFYFNFDIFSYLSTYIKNNSTLLE